MRVVAIYLSLSVQITVMALPWRIWNGYGSKGSKTLLSVEENNHIIFQFQSKQIIILLTFI